MLDQHTTNLLERLVIAEEKKAQKLEEISETLDSMRNTIDAIDEQSHSTTDAIDNVDYTLSEIKEVIENDNKM